MSIKLTRDGAVGRLTAPADLRPAGAGELFRSIWHFDHHDLGDRMNSGFRKEKTTPRVGDEPSDHPGFPPRSPRAVRSNRGMSSLRQSAGRPTKKVEEVVTVTQFWTYAVNRQPAQLSGQADRTYE